MPAFDHGRTRTASGVAWVTKRAWAATALWASAFVIAGGAVVLAAVLFVQSATGDTRTLNRDTLTRLYRVAGVLSNMVASGQEQQTALVFEDIETRQAATEKSIESMQAAQEMASAYNELLTDPQDIDRWARIQLDVETVVNLRLQVLQLLADGNEAGALALTTGMIPLINDMNAALAAEIEQVRLSGDAVEQSAVSTASRARWALLAGGVAVAALGAAGGVVITRRANRAVNAERERAAALIAEQQRRMDATLSTLDEAVWSMSLPDRTLLYANSATHRLLGIGRETPQGRGWMDFVHVNDLPTAYELSRDAVATGNASAEFRVETAEGERWLRVGLYVAYDEGGQPVRMDGVAIDITEHRRAQDMLLGIQRLELIGQLVSTVAHDFNNMLTVINGFADMALRDLDPGTPTYECVTEIREAGERAGALTARLLAAARRQPHVVAPVDVASLVDEMRPFLRRAVPESITLGFEIEPEACVVRSDPQQVEQAVLNLVVNARDAFGNGGRVLVAVRSLHVESARDATVGRIAPGDYVVVSVSDTGSGIDPALLPQIFEPFVTTKPHGRGTGLGLSGVRSVVEQAGGAITVDTRLGQGTTFDLYFPAYTQPVSDATAPIPATSPSGTETILVIDDDRQVRQIAASVLGVLGYRVLEAGDTAEAIRLCREEAPDLVLTDLVMPGLNGPEIAEHCRKVHPGIPVVMMTGYFDDEARAVLEQLRAVLLRKPFTPEALGRAIRDALDAA